MPSPWLQPDGGWGWSNAGLIVSGDESLLVDTLFDLPNTREMLDAMKRAHTAAADIDRLVNTHSNGDHTHGNELVAGAEIVASKTAAAEMEATTPEALAALMRGARGRTEAWSATFWSSASAASSSRGSATRRPLEPSREG